MVEREATKRAAEDAKAQEDRNKQERMRAEEKKQKEIAALIKAD